MKLAIISILTLSVSLSLHAQESSFGQFYNLVEFHNPAFVGDAHQYRVQAANRIMSPIPGKQILNSYVSASTKMLNQNSGIGFIFFNQNDDLSHTKLQVNYSYTINWKRKWWVKAGIGVGINQRKFNSSLHFPDQYNLGGLTGALTQEAQLNDKAYFPSFNTGGIIYNKFFWASVAGDYLNRPQEDFAGQKNPFPIKLAVMGGILYPINKGKSSKRRFSRFGGLKPYTSVGPLFSYIRHGYISDITVGFSFQSQPFFGSLAYRHQTSDLQNGSTESFKAASISAGYRNESLSIGYSFDWSLAGHSVNRNGAHELSVVFFFTSGKEDYKRLQLVPLPNQLIY